MDFSKFDMNLLRVLDALLITRSTTVAGQQVGLSQSAVSSALGRLRVALNDPLFLREGRHLVPTDYAQSLAQPVRAILAETEALLTRPTSFEPARSERHFHILGAEFWGAHLLPELMAHLASVAPGVTLYCATMSGPDPSEALLLKRADLALCPMCDLPDWAAAQPLYRAGQVLLARQDHPRLVAAGLAPGDTVPSDLLAELPRADCGANPGQKAGRTVVTLPDVHTLAAMLSRTPLVSILPRPLAVHLVTGQGLAVYALPEPIAVTDVAMVWHVRSQNDPAHRWLRERLADML
ncbi:HTH-type transcriptional regulator LeuO [Roseovarius sp. EC-HK134]|nr:HTH-type transcriptional regulator LeuO [Roseovarius sp. EC-HK134]VVT12127.1 HTH-type transcriptional regulator LeuO [Roseovarius sp. EC-SD190]